MAEMATSVERLAEVLLQALERRQQQQRQECDRLAMLEREAIRRQQLELQAQHERHQREASELTRELLGLLAGGAKLKPTHSDGGDKGIACEVIEPTEDEASEHAETSVEDPALRGRLFKLSSTAEPADASMKEFDLWTPAVAEQGANPYVDAAPDHVPEASFPPIVPTVYDLEEPVHEPESALQEMEHDGDGPDGLPPHSADAVVAEEATESPSSDADDEESARPLTVETMRDEAESAESVSDDSDVGGPASVTKQAARLAAEDEGAAPSHTRQRPRRAAAVAFTAEELQRAVAAAPLTSNQMKQLRAIRKRKSEHLRKSTDTSAMEELEASIRVVSSVINLELHARRLRPA